MLIIGNISSEQEAKEIEFITKTQLKIREGRLTKEEPGTAPVTESGWDKTKLK